jgi:ABC-2 type transport system ATP-binding protein
VLLSLREHTTVLLSTHILSDVERICTDVAFLNNGKVEIQGKLSEIKKHFRKDGYELETDSESEALKLLVRFPKMKRTGRCRILFSENDYSPSGIMRHLADRNVSILKIERIEPTLEDLFMEVADK